jgi:hypothetical protein
MIASSARMLVMILLYLLEKQYNNFSFVLLCYSHTEKSCLDAAGLNHYASKKSNIK